MTIIIIISSFIFGVSVGVYLKRDKSSCIYKPNEINGKIDTILDQWDKEELREQRHKIRKELYNKITAKNKKEK